MKQALTAVYKSRNIAILKWEHALATVRSGAKLLEADFFSGIYVSAQSSLSVLDSH
jgi:hypothetical protein